MLCPLGCLYMSDWHSFEGRITTMEWGKNTYTVLRLPADVSAALEAEGARRVEGELGDFPVNLALTKAPVIDGVFVYTGKELLKQSGLAPGETFDARLRLADPDLVDTLPEVLTALRAAGLTQSWQALTAGKQRGLLHPINAAKRVETRQKRIIALLAQIGE